MALDRNGFKRLSDDASMDITKLSEDDKGQLYYKDEPFTAKKLHQRLIITYSPKYARFVNKTENERNSEKKYAKIKHYYISCIQHKVPPSQYL